MRNVLVRCCFCEDEIFQDLAVYVNGTGGKTTKPRCMRCHENEVKDIPLTNHNRAQKKRTPGASDQQYKGSVLPNRRP